MATQIQYRRGTNSQNAAFTGALGEITVDTTNGTLRVHDGITAGGSNIATVSYVAGQISSLSSNSISFGTSNVRVASSGGNVVTSVGGTANVLNVTSTGAIITGDLSVTGNATLSGNILGDRIQNGTTSIDIQTVNGNANISVAGISNVAVFANTGVYVGGLISSSGNITGNYILGNGSQLTGIDATSIQSGTSNVRVVSSGGNVATGVGGTANVVVVATTGQFVTGLISASGNITGGNILGGANVNATTHTGATVSVTGAITGAALTGTSLTVSTGNITAGNLLLTGAIVDSAQLDIQTSAANANVVVTPNGTGNLNVTTGVSITGNITAGNVYGTLRTAAQPAITSVGTLSSLAVTANIDGGNLRTTGLISATGAITGSSLTVSTGNVSCGNIVNTNANGVGNIGSSTTYFNTVFAKATSAQYADLAEMYSAGASYEPGTVVVFGGAYEVEISTTSHANHVAGVVSTNPSYIMNAGQTGQHVVAIALQGRVPTKVIGTISKGDRMVSSPIPGVAQALDPTKYDPGCIIGKALAAHQPVFDEQGNEIPGTIEVVVGRV
jgi:hypothetical protein